MLGFSSTAFVFAACYGPIPEKYHNQEYADSVRMALEEDTLAIVNASDDIATDNLLYREDASHSPDNNGNTDN